MDAQFLIWLTSVASLVGCFVYLALKLSPQIAIGIIVGITFITPAWLIFPMFDTPNGTIVASGPNVKITVTSICLILYCFLPGRTFPVSLVPTDFAMLAVVFIHLISDVRNSGFDWMIILRMYAEWYAPYIAGRLTFQNLRIHQPIWKTFAVASMLLGLFAVIESFTYFNIFEWIAGERPLEGMPHDTVRWGIRRAYGPTMHPIYLGVLLLLLLPWSIYGQLQALKKLVHFAWALFPIFPIVGIVSTGSRAPIIGMLIFGGILAFCKFRSARLPILLTTVAALFLISFNFWWVIEKLEDWSGETQDLLGQKVHIDGERIKLTGVRTRIIMLDVYRIAINRSGMLGYGTIATSGFPINVPISGQEVDTLNRVRFIDNSYILMLLRFGYVGLAGFLIACIAATVQLFVISRSRQSPEIKIFTSMLGSTLTAVFLVLTTVWTPEEIGFPLLWTMGCSSGLFREYSLKRYRNSSKPL